MKARLSAGVGSVISRCASTAGMLCVWNFAIFAGLTKRRYLNVALQKVSEFKELTIQYQSNGPSTMEFYTDFPGAIPSPPLGLRSTQTIASSNNMRATRTFPLDGVEGTEFYIKFIPGTGSAGPPPVPATQLRLFSGVVKVRMIGVYLDGSIGEVWNTTVIALGA